MKWFRFYAEALHDPKAQRLPAPLFKHWVNLLCLVTQEDSQGVVPPVADVAYHLGISVPQTIKMLSELVSVRLLDRTDDDETSVHNWNERQPRSDNAAERMRNIRRTSPEHVPAREDKTREEQKRTEETRSKPVRVADPIDQIAADFAAFGKVTAGVPRAIEEAVEDYGAEWTALAVRKAGGSGFEGLPPWSFVESILMRWKKAGQPDEGAETNGPQRTYVGGNANPAQQAIDVAAELARYGQPSVIVDLPVYTRANGSGPSTLA